MSQSCPTTQIQTEKTEDNPSGIVVINESDFDETTMQRVSESAQQESDQAPAKVDNAPAAPEAPAGAKATKVVAPWAATK